jgi:Tripartite tricarboxylate transporter TctB family
MTGGMAKADFVTGLVLIALGIAIVVASLAMPRFAELEVNPYTAPGLVPGALGLVILILGTALFVRAARVGGWRLLDRAPGRRSWHSDPGTRNLALAVLLCLAYAAGLVGRVPFWLATFLFMALFVAAFEWPLVRTRAERLRRIAFAVAFGAVVSAAVTLVFQEIFLVRLP